MALQELANQFVKHDCGGGVTVSTVTSAKHAEPDVDAGALVDVPLEHRMQGADEALTSLYVPTSHAVTLEPRPV
jgi:hypothetical protein